MRVPARHTCTGERFRTMSDETLRKVLRRMHRFAADTVADQTAAQQELRRRREAKR